MILDKSYIMRIYISYIIKYHPISNQFLDSMLNSEMIVMLVLLERILFWRKPWPQGPIDNPNSIATMSVLSRSHRFHIVFHIVFHTVFLSSCFSLWFFHRFPSPLRSTEVSLGHPLRRGPWPWHPRFRLGKLGILGSNKFAVSRSLGNEGQWGAMEKNMENDGKWWKVGDLYCFVLYCFELFRALYFSLWTHYDISNLEIWWGRQVRTLVSPPGDIESAEKKGHSQMVQRGRCSSTEHFKHWKFALNAFQWFMESFPRPKPEWTKIHRAAPNGIRAIHTCPSRSSLCVMKRHNSKQKKSH